MNTKHTYGWLPQLPDQRDFIYKPTLTSVPVSVDLRAKMPAVYDQGNLGSCTANAIAAHLDFDRQNQGEKFLTPSRLFIYYNERLAEHTTKSDSGATIRGSVKAVVKYGAPAETEWPYVDDGKTFAKKPLKACYTNAVPNEAVKYEAVSRNVATMQACLASGLPFAIGFTVYESFESDAVAKNGIVPMPAKSESVLGGHAVLVCGYTTISGSPYWIVRNSWGASWGDKGYFYMPQAYLMNTSLSSDFWVVQTVK